MKLISQVLHTVLNFVKDREIRNKLIFTLFVLFVSRIGLHLILPGVKPSSLILLSESLEIDPTKTVLDIFSGNGISNASFFCLATIGMLSSSAILKIVENFGTQSFKTIVSNHKITIEKCLKLLISVIYSFFFVSFLNRTLPEAAFYYKEMGINFSFYFALLMILICSGSLFVDWLAILINKYGLGNGEGILITAGMLSVLPSLIKKIILNFQNGALVLLGLSTITILLIGFHILFYYGIRKLVILFAKQMVVRDSNIVSSKTQNYVPIAFNDIPIVDVVGSAYIFSYFIFFLLSSVFSFSIDIYGIWFNITLACLSLFLAFVHNALHHNPKKYSEYLKRKNAFIPGVKPGVPTADFIDAIVTRLTLPYALYCTIIAILPAIIFNTFCAEPQIPQFVGGVFLPIAIGNLLIILFQVTKKQQSGTESPQTVGTTPQA